MYRREIRRATGTRVAGDFGTKAFNAGLFGGAINATVKGIRCSGDPNSNPSNTTCRPLPAGTHASQEQIVSFTGIQFPQPPNYLFFVYQKDPSQAVSYMNPLNLIDTVQSAHDATRWDTVAARGAFNNNANTRKKGHLKSFLINNRI